MAYLGFIFGFKIVFFSLSKIEKNVYYLQGLLLRLDQSIVGIRSHVVVQIALVHRNVPAACNQLHRAATLFR